MNKKQKKILGNIILIISILLLISILFNFFRSPSVLDKPNNELINSINISEETKNKIKFLEDGTKYLIHPNQIKSGGPPKGGIGFDRGIPALDKSNINFVTIKQADSWIEDNELVLVLNYKNETRVYPLQIMVWHEIVNDVIDDEKILITYCPLCGSGIAYKSRVEINGSFIETKFGTSGKLYNSNLIMYDELTSTYWQQIGGQAIIGSLTGQELELIDLDTVVWRDFKNSTLNVKVLSQDTGISRDYGKDPYGNYYEDTFLIFPVDNSDNRIHPKTVIFGIEKNNSYIAYREKDVIDILIDQENNIKIIKNDDGTISIINLDNNEIIPKERDFWFAWYTFHPNTQLYGVERNN